MSQDPVPFLYCDLYKRGGEEGGEEEDGGNDLPEQLYPSPVNLGRQVQVTLPSSAVQLASALQFPLFIAHSLISVTSHHRQRSRAALL